MVLCISITDNYYEEILVKEPSNESIGLYSIIMKGAYWYNQCKPYFKWGFDPCNKKSCYNDCVVFCERSYEFKKPGFVLHYQGCDLDCRFCWANDLRSKPSINKNPSEIVAQLICKLHILSSDKFIMKARTKPSDICTIRLTGNEPSLQWDHIMHLFEILNDENKISTAIDEVRLTEEKDLTPIKQIHQLKILVQTNGIEIGRPESRINLNDLRKFKNLDMTFEVSFKGVNPDQFEWLADRPKELFEYQCNAFVKLWESRSNNIHVVPELGINHSNSVKKGSDLAIRIVDHLGNPIDFTDYSKTFKESVLSRMELGRDDNIFKEFSQINRDRARSVIQTYSQTTGLAKNCLPSEF